MTITEPQVAMRGLYGPIATAKILGIHRNTLRNYVTRRLIKSETSILNGRDYFRGKEILRFWNFATTTKKKTWKD